VANSAIIKGGQLTGGNNFPRGRQAARPKHARANGRTGTEGRDAWVGSGGSVFVADEDVEEGPEEEGEDGAGEGDDVEGHAEVRRGDHHQQRGGVAPAMGIRGSGCGGGGRPNEG